MELFFLYNLIANKIGNKQNMPNFNIESATLYET